MERRNRGDMMQVRRDCYAAPDFFLKKEREEKIGEFKQSFSEKFCEGWRCCLP